MIPSSLAPINHVAVAPNRKARVEAGVELYEVKVHSVAVRGNAAPDAPVRLTLHTKAVLVVSIQSGLLRHNAH